MKKLSFILMACLLALGLTQCKKNELPKDTDDGNYMSITLKLDNSGEKELPEEDNDGQKVHPEEDNGLANIVYDDNDTIYVGSNGKYVGYLIYNRIASLFTGSINIDAAIEGQPLQFIFMGGRRINGLDNNSTSCTFNIGDQSNDLAVISCAASIENFSLNNLNYSAYLRNKCALVKFDLGEDYEGAITLTGMKTEATIGFDGTVTNLGTTGDIVTYSTNDKRYRYAVVLSNQTVVSDGTIRMGGNAVGTFSIPTAAYTNAFLTNATMTFGSYAVPLTLEALTGGSIVVLNPQSGMKYALNGGGKMPVPSEISVSLGDRVAFYGDGTTITSYSDDNLEGTKIGGNAQVKVYGNIMSLINETGYATCTTLPNGSSYNFAGLFILNANLTDASGLLLPATTLTPYCYMAMFANCTSLTAAPALPAETLADGCYGTMFQGCTSLTTVPAQLPATTLATECYISMFQDCTHLTAAPLLSATTLAQSCCESMFNGCTSLTTVPALSATTLAESCCESMFNGCTNLTSVPTQLPAETLAQRCYESMFNGCTNLTIAPALPAETLVQSCYESMFSGCTSLKSVNCSATNIGATDCTNNWLNNAGSSVTGERKTFTTPGNTSWNTSASGIPARWIRLNPDGSLWDGEEVTSSTPLTLLALTDGTITVQNPKSGMKYSVTGGNVETLSSTTDINVFAGDRVRFYGNSNKYKGTKISGGSAEVKVYGNIMSLLNGENYSNADALSENEAFDKLFQDNTKLIDASGLLLPATTLTSYCYNSMFDGCTNLTTVSTNLLPATTMKDGCYQYMFCNCTSLTTVPSLPASKLAKFCYLSMFQGCVNLTTAPEQLPATELADHCYKGMFQGCTSLTTAPTLPATSLNQSCYESMFKYCENLTAAPELPAPILVSSCYLSMFINCYKLNSITCLATSGINEEYSTNGWMSNAGRDVEGTKTFTRASGASVSADDTGSGSTWPRSNDGIPSGWTVVSQ